MTLLNDLKAWLSSKKPQSPDASPDEPDAAPPPSLSVTQSKQSRSKSTKQPIAMSTQIDQNETLASPYVRNLSHALPRATVSTLLSPKLAAHRARIMKASTTFLLFWKTHLTPTIQKAREWMRAHKKERAVIAASFLLVAFPTPIIVRALSLFGFGTGGVIDGGIAALIQSCIGNVAAGSLFAILQSAAMGGFGLAVVAGVVQGAGLLVGGVVALRAYKKTRAAAKEKTKTD